MTAPPCHVPQSSLACLWPLGMHGEEVTCRGQGLASFILQAGETLPATKQDLPHKTPEVTFNVSQSGRDGEEGLRKAMHLDCSNSRVTSCSGKGKISNRLGCYLYGDDLHEFQSSHKLFERAVRAKWWVQVVISVVLL